MSEPLSDSPLGCAIASSRHVEVNGLRLHLLEGGRTGGPVVCFLHGGSAHAHWFDAVLPHFADRFHVVSLDQRGHGDSQWASPPAYATEDFAADLAALMDGMGWPRMAVVGHSMGGHNATAFAAWHPERVSALVVVDSRPALPRERLESMHERARRAPRLHPTRESALRSFRLLPRETIAAPELLQHLAGQGLTNRDGGWTYRFDPACNGARRPADLWPLLPRITAPTLIVRGELSPIMTPEIASRMLAAIPTARFVEIPGAYHHLVLDTPAPFNAAMRKFLDEVVPG
ncbi:MAG TPA: alpha/beta hydrolase [Candidatus Limnocylindria bacterium]|nr:alpha/beta hydrolase [Candidatus Limnocylindria bacterium]